MEQKKQFDKEDKALQVLYWLTAIVPLLPITCNYMMQGGILTEWIARIRELGTRSFLLFPTEQVYFESGINDNIFNSNIPFWFSGIFYRLSHHMVLTYRLTMLAIQLVTFFSAKAFFKAYFGGKEKYAVYFGVLLYVICPYRIYVCYDHADLSMAVAWALIPLFAWAMQRTVTGEKADWKRLGIAAFSLAAIAYTHFLVFMTMLGITGVVMLVKRAWRLLPAMIAAGALSVPALIPLLRYLLRGGYEVWNLSCQSIMPQGYRLGSFFNTYVYVEEHPGFGIGMLICLGTAVWIRFVGGVREKKNGQLFALTMGVFFMLLASRKFPWEYVQRLGVPFLRLVGLWKTPAVFSGIAYCFFCITAGNAMEKQTFEGDDEKYGGNLILLFRVVVMIICISLCIYQCNMLTYTRLPIEL